MRKNKRIEGPKINFIKGVDEGGLQKLSKDELIQIIISQKKRIEELESILEEVEARLRQHENPHTPSSKKRFKENTKKKEEEKKKSEEEKKEGKKKKDRDRESKDSDEERFPGRKKDHEGAGINLPSPDRVVKHTIEKDGYEQIDKREKTVIDLPNKPFVVTKHIIYKYLSPDGETVEAEANLPEGVYGKNLQAFNCLLKGKLGASHKGIADLFGAIRPDLSFCPATSLNITNRMAENLATVRDEIEEEIRKSFYCNADETGLRQDGENGWAWTFCTPTHALYETDPTRSGDVPERILGEDNDLFVVRDGWGAYNNYRGQRCWVHLDREFEELAEDDKKVRPHYEYFCDLYERAKEAKEKPPPKRKKFVQKMDSEEELGDLVKTLSELPGCSEFATKLQNARPYLFTGVLHPEIPLHNNHAERTLREIVVHRKRMGCIRNEKGQKFVENVMSAIQTWKLQEKNQFKQLKKFTS